jgi:hypothetical protein
MPINLPTIPSIAVFLCSALLAFGYAAPATDTRNRQGVGHV